MQLVEDAQPPAADDGDQGVDVLCLQLLQQLVGQVDFFDHVVVVHLADVERVDPGRLAEQPGRSRIQVLDQLGAEGHQPAIGVTFRVQHPVEAVPDADHLPSQLARRHGRPHDHGVEPGHVPGADHDGDASVETGMTDLFGHVHLLSARFHNSSYGSAALLSALFVAPPPR